MILVLDTNVVVSSIVNKKGYSAQIRRLWKQEVVQIAVSEPILNEIKRVLRYPHIQKRHQWSSRRLERFVKQLGTKALKTKGKGSIGVIINDPSDDKFLSCAVKAKADLIVSGDEHLLSLVSYQDIPIVTPRECMKKLTGDKDQ